MTDLDKIAIMLEAGSPECACMKCEECPGVHVPADEGGVLMNEWTKTIARWSLWRKNDRI